MTRPTRAALRLVPAAALLLIGTVDAQPTRAADPDARLAQTLDLSADQHARLRAAVQTRAAQPGGSWALAAEAARILTPAQLTRLRERTADRPTEALRGQRPGRADARERRREETGRRDGPRERGAQMRQRRGEAAGRSERARLTDAHRSALHDAMTSARERRTALVEQFRAGQLSDNAFVAQTRALREQTAAEAAHIAPDARRAQPARRDAVEAAREAALGLTATQKAELQRIRLDAIRTAPARPSDRTQRPTESEREAMQAQRARAEAVYTPEQRAVLDVHRALVRAGRGTRPANRSGATTE